MGSRGREFTLWIPLQLSTEAYVLSFTKDKGVMAPGNGGMLANDMARELTKVSTTGKPGLRRVLA
jgi:hypothetical protein